MLKVTEIKELIRALDRSSVDELTIIEEGKQRLTLKKQGKVTKAPISMIEQGISPASSPQQETEPLEKKPLLEKPTLTEGLKEGFQEITSPMVGTFYKAPSPDSEPYVKVGEKVVDDQIVCIVEAMKLMNEIEAGVNGEIVAVLVENGQLVEYGQPLFQVRVANE
ncbi:acetyl-CoA carboxylase biotin carboxyl carrier protein [Halalkalibacterium ligniniphilum]|uniref:acetyl-CoA carboxylase biotin carboxyl carrier protein n=1 Tax=Halalkalibacterium ligniniphilum TaxID=1134413 RepID=UPI00034BD8F7|nr:acetyl-CoA carboxylase biotin carboxyl carrier protein [Halalkalibacterium ligniniphilum]